MNEYEDMEYECNHPDCRINLRDVCHECGHPMGIHSGQHPHPHVTSSKHCHQFIGFTYDQPRLPTAEETYELLRQAEL